MSPVFSSDKNLPVDASRGARLHALAADLYDIPTSITGSGLRGLLERLRRELPPLAVHHVASGDAVLDWTIPDEWNVRDAFVAAASGERVIDWREHRLHLVQYAEPVRTRLAWRDLAPRLHTLPDRPHWIPYRTSYYGRTWGFCCSQRTFDALASRGEDATYDIVIDATLAPGALSYGEVVVPGRSEDEVLISAHVCHPQLANDNAASVAVAARLAQELLARAEPPHLTHRFLFAPGTIGAIAWLARNRDRLARIRAGLVLATLGDAGPFVYKRSRRGTLNGDLPVDAAVRGVLRQRGAPFEIRDFEPFGYDERQFGSPGFDLPVGRLSRTPHGEYPEYHTSADDLSLITPEALEESLQVLLDVVDALDASPRASRAPMAREPRGPVFRSTYPDGEPQLGRRGLYAALGGHADAPQRQRALLWVLNLADGDHGLQDIAARAGLALEDARQAADTLLAHDLIRPFP